MKIIKKSQLIYSPIIAAVCLGLTGCSSTRPMPYSELGVSAQLKPNPHDSSGRIPYAYSTDTDWSKYSSVIVDPVVVYEGSDNQFEKVPEAEKQSLAQYLKQQVSDQLKLRYQLVDVPGPDTLRVKLTIAGANPTVPLLSTFTRVDMAGLACNLVQSIRGKEGLFTGTVSFAVEVSESDSGRLLSAYVEKQYPNALNIKATLGKWSATKTGIRKGAADLSDQLRGQ